MATRMRGDQCKPHRHRLRSRDSCLAAQSAVSSRLRAAGIAVKVLTRSEGPLSTLSGGWPRLLHGRGIVVRSPARMIAVLTLSLIDRGSCMPKYQHGANRRSRSSTLAVIGEIGVR
jgi:hypothetical protein